MSAPVGTLEWERAGGPPLSAGQKLQTLAGAAAIVTMHLAGQLRWRLGAGPSLPRKVELKLWDPPETQAARDAEKFLRDVSSPQMVAHSVRTYLFAGVLYDLSDRSLCVDKEALYVAALMHDVGLFEAPRPAGERCFTVGGAREARRIARAAGWEEGRANAAAMAITSNLNAFVPAKKFGAEAHFMSAGGRVEVLAQEWKVHPENVAEILARWPREGFAADSLAHVANEARLNPGGRFACLDPLFPMMVRRSRFVAEAPR